jgi:hypothetical protein
MIVKNTSATPWYVAVLLLQCVPAVAQHQLVVLSGENVVARFRVGDNFRSQWVGEKTEHWGYLVEINKFSMITSQDTIALNKIGKVLLPGERRTHQLGKKLVQAGVGLFIIDQFNITVIQQGSPDLNGAVWKASAAITAAGVTMLFFKKNWKKISGRVRLVSVGRDSRYFQAE